MTAATLDSRKNRTAIFAFLGALGMLGLGFAAVPLYQMFCQVTGFGGTTQRASESDAALAERLGGERLIEAILEHSHTCYEGVREERHSWGYGCGVCPACGLRAKGHAEWTAWTER